MSDAPDPQTPGETGSETTDSEITDAEAVAETTVSAAAARAARTEAAESEVGWAPSPEPPTAPFGPGVATPPPPVRPVSGPFGADLYREPATVAHRPEAPDTRSEPPHRSATRHPSALDLMTAILLIVVALLISIGSFLPLAAGDALTDRPWAGTDATGTRIDYLGVPLTVAALISVIGAILLFAGAGRGGSALRSLGVCGAGLALGVTSTAAARAIGDELPLQLGFWVLVAAAAVALPTIALGTIAARRPAPEPPVPPLGWYPPPPTAS